MSALLESNRYLLELLSGFPTVKVRKDTAGRNMGCNRKVTVAKETVRFQMRQPQPQSCCCDIVDRKVGVKMIVLPQEIGQCP